MSNCECGNQVQYSFQSLGCQDCGGAVCPKCAVPLESVSYCRSCAGDLLGTTVETSDDPFELGG